MKHIFFVAFMSFLANTPAKAQYRHCTALREFLQKEGVVANFKKQAERDSTFVLITRVKNFDCDSFDWMDNKITVKHDSAVSNLLLRVTPFRIFQERCRYYLLMNFKKENHGYYFEVLQPCSGLLARGRLRKKGDKFELTSLERSVIH